MKTTDKSYEHKCLKNVKFQTSLLWKYFNFDNTININDVCIGMFKYVVISLLYKLTNF